MELINNMKRLLSGSDVYDESEKLTPQDQVALKNIIQIAKERIWIADPINASEYDDDYFSYYEKLTNQISNSMEMTGGRSLTVKEKIAKDYLTFIKLINAQYASLKKMKCSINLMEAYLLKNSTKE